MIIVLTLNSRELKYILFVGDCRKSRKLAKTHYDNRPAGCVFILGMKSLSHCP